MKEIIAFEGNGTGKYRPIYKEDMSLEKLKEDINEQTRYLISVHDDGEPCSGFLKQWGSKEDLIEILEDTIKEIKSLNI